MCQKWLGTFHAGVFSLDDAPGLGRPVKVDSDQIKTLIENNQFYTRWEIADILKISKSIKLSVKMKNVSFILWKKLNELSGKPNGMSPILHRTNVCIKKVVIVYLKFKFIWGLNFYFLFSKSGNLTQT